MELDDLTEDALVPLMRNYLDAVDRLSEMEADGGAATRAGDIAIRDVIDARLDLYRCLQALGWQAPVIIGTTLDLDEQVSRLSEGALDRLA